MTTAFCALWLKPEAAEKLAVVSGEPVNEMHLTLFMADVKDEDIDNLVRYVRGYALASSSLSGTTTGVGVFTDMTGETGDAFHVTTSIPGLLEFRRNLVKRAEMFADTWKTYEYNPHITVKYLRMNESLPYTRGPIIPLEFDKVVLRVSPEKMAPGTKTYTEYQFSLTDNVVEINI